MNRPTITEPMPKSPNSIRHDLMKRLAHLHNWNQMDRTERHRRTAAFIASNARTCMKVVELLHYPPSDPQQSIIDRLMADVAAQFEETFGLVAPWVEEPPAEAGIAAPIVKDCDR